MNAQAGIKILRRAQKWIDLRRRGYDLAPGLATCAGFGMLICWGAVLGVAPLVAGLFCLPMVVAAWLCGFRQAAFGALVAMACVYGYLTLPRLGLRVANMRDVVVMAEMECRRL